MPYLHEGAVVAVDGVGVLQRRDGLLIVLQVRVADAFRGEVGGGRDARTGGHRDEGSGDEDLTSGHWILFV